MKGGRTESRKALFMSVVKPLADTRTAHRICLFVVAFSALPAVSTYAADFKQDLKFGPPLVVTQATPPKGTKAAPQASPVAPNSTAAEIVGRMLSNPPSDPDVPLPRGDLGTRPATEGGLDHPTIYGRQEEGGA